MSNSPVDDIQSSFASGGLPPLMRVGDGGVGSGSVGRVDSGGQSGVVPSTDPYSIGDRVSSEGIRSDGSAS